MAKRRAHDSAQNAAPARAATSGTTRHVNGASRWRGYGWIAARFLLLLNVLFLMLMILWPVIGDAYRRSFVSVSHTLFHSMGRNVSVVFERIDEQDGRDISMQVHNRQAGMMVERHLPSRYAGYMPTAMLLALIAATPLPWRRRLFAAAIGLVAMHVYITGVLLMTIARVLSRHGPAQLFELPSILDGLLSQFVHHSTTSPTFSALVPVIVWAAVTFRRGDLALLAPRDMSEAVTDS